MLVKQRIRPFVLFFISLMAVLFVSQASVVVGAVYSNEDSSAADRPSGWSDVGFAATQRIQNFDVGANSPYSVADDARNVKYISHIGGSIRAVAVQGNYAYVGEGPAFTILDISNATVPVVAGNISPLPYYIADIAVAGDYAYVAAEKDGLRIFDVANPAEPTEVGFYIYAPPDDESPDPALAVAVSGSYAYLANEDGGLRIVDVSNPAAPVEIGAYGGGEILDVVVKGNYAYVAVAKYEYWTHSWQGGLHIVNVSDPSNPLFIGSFDTAGYVGGIAVAGNFSYVTDFAGLHIVNVSNRAVPEETGFYNKQSLKNLDVAGDFAYVTDSSRLRIIDVTDSSAPTMTGYKNLLREASDVVVADNHAFVALGPDGLQIVDVSNPEAPAKAGSYKPPGYGLARRLAKAGNQLFVVTDDGGLRILDVSDPYTPVEISSFQTREETRAVAAAGDFAYVSCSQDPYDNAGSFLQVIGVGDPADPVGLGIYESSWGYPYSLVASGSYVYAAAGDYGFVIYDVTDLSKPMQIANASSIHSSYRELAVAGNFAYVANGDYGMDIIDVSRPAEPKVVGVFKRPDHSEHVSDVAVAGKYAYLANGWWLHIVNVSNPAKPKLISVFDPPPVGHIEKVAVAGNFAYALDSDGRRLHVVDVSDPAKPVEVGYYQTPGVGSDLVVDGDIIYIAEDDVLILQFIDPTVPPVADFSASLTSGLPPLQVEFTNLSTGVYDECIWDFGNGITKTTCEETSTKYRSEGNYTVSLTVKGPGGEDTKTIEQYIKVGYYRIFLPGVLMTD